MNILLNLLPEDKKAFLKERVRSRFVFSQMLMLVFFQVFYIFILGGAFFSLEYNRMLSQNAVQGPEGDRNNLLTIEKKFQETNRATEAAALLHREHFHWSDLLVKIEQALPSGIVISGIVTKDYGVDLSGTAKERANLVALERNLNEELCFENINIPPSSWLSPKDIRFQMSFSVKKDCVK